MSLYDTLGIKPDATQKEIKDAYRKKSKKHHPDKGGDGKKFGVIAASYKILSDAHKRKRYDETGIEDDISSSAKEANGLLQKMFIKLLEQVGVKKVLNTDVVGLMKTGLKEMALKAKDGKKKVASQKEDLEKVLKRINCKDGPNNLSVVVQGQIDNEMFKLENITMQLESIKIAEKMLKGYGFKFDMVEVPDFRTFTSVIRPGYTFQVDSL